MDGKGNEKYSKQDFLRGEGGHEERFREISISNIQEEEHFEEDFLFGGKRGQISAEDILKGNRRFANYLRFAKLKVKFFLVP